MEKGVIAYFLQHVLTKGWFRISLVAVMILLGVTLYVTKQTPNINPGSLDIISTEDKLAKGVAEFYKRETSEDEIPLTEAEVDSYITAEKTVNYLFSMAQVGDEQLFPSVFLPEVYQEDFLKFSIAERLSKVKESMKRITRNDQLVKVEIIRNLWVINKDSTRIVVDIHYKDLSEPIRINFLLKSVKQNPANLVGKDTEQDVYFVSSSVWEIVRNIES